MKVLITNKYRTWENATTGKGKFIRRLIPELAKLGIMVSRDPEEECDIQLGVGKFVFDTSCKKKILRLGPVHFFKKDYKKLNRIKKDAYKKADGIIYQSKFCQDLAHAFLGKQRCPEAIIYNGASPSFYEVSRRPKEFRHNFMCSTREWTDQKRLKDIVGAFWDAKIRNSCLYVCGYADKGKMTITDNTRKCAVTYTGLLGDKALAHYYKMVDLFINITYLDACPNAVVEALVAGCPVFVCPDGGAMELLTIADPKLHEMPKWQKSDYNFKPVTAIPDYPQRILADVMTRVSKRKTRLPFDASPFYIHKTARHYKQFFNEVLCQK